MALPPSRPDLAVRRARGAVGAMFLTNGALYANLVPRLPEIKSALDLGNASYGLAIAAFPTGAVVSGLAAGLVVRRFGSARVAAIGTVLTGLGTLGAGLSPTFALLVAALFLGGVSDSITDVAQNTHGLRVQRRYGRSIINGFHAVWSIGAVLGGSMAAAAIAFRVPLEVHLGVALAIFAVVAVVAFRFRLRGPDDEADDGAPATTGARLGVVGTRTVVVLASLVLIAIGGALVEDAGSSWATLYLHGSLGAPAALAATAYVALVGSQTVGRLLGDRLVDRFGQRAVACAGGVVIALGMGLALAWPTVPGTIAGFAAAGLGSATLIPAAMHEADELPGLRPGTGLTVVSWLLRLGFLFSPPLVGLVADSVGLRTGLLVVPIAGLLVVLLSPALRGRGTAVTRTER
ncbi:MFS transporter [Promicromonospora thailandica]|uniref:Fucose permease n=1 Tax=Promicromonospora thailandica TaxID=765201 RepID=A0A9X2G8D2_9MICO|nr:MFS transporter [Promicromonospora thailandica]MCP2267463.1 Fucose permease [Promicromonospora thailandica]